MVKRVLFILLMLLLCVVAFYAISNDKRENNTFKIKEEIEIVDSTIISKMIRVDFLFPASSENQVVYHEKYSFSYSEKDEQSEWVAYKLFKNSINNSVKRKNNFREDQKVITGSSILNDYKNSGYDKGHLVPAKTMSFSEETMSESFYMSNMSPQKPSFNRGVWKRLEEKVRSWISISDSLYVITGPILNNPIERIGENRVAVPNFYYKSIIRFKNNKFFGIGFLLKNEKSNKKPYNFSVSIDSIEKVTGLNFFYQLDSLTQNRIESNSSYQYFLQK